MSHTSEATRRSEAWLFSLRSLAVQDCTGDKPLINHTDCADNRLVHGQVVADGTGHQVK